MGRPNLPMTHALRLRDHGPFNCVITCSNHALHLRTRYMCDGSAVFCSVSQRKPPFFHERDVERYSVNMAIVEETPLHYKREPCLTWLPIHALEGRELPRHSCSGPQSLSRETGPCSGTSKEDTPFFSAKPLASVLLPENGGCVEHLAPFRVFSGSTAAADNENEDDSPHFQSTEIRIPPNDWRFLELGQGAGCRENANCACATKAFLQCENGRGSTRLILTFHLARSSSTESDLAAGALHTCHW